MTQTHYSEPELASRWRISTSTLQRWRRPWLSDGPRFLKLGSRVVYRLADIEAYEALQTRGGSVVAPEIKGDDNAD